MGKNGRPQWTLLRCEGFDPEFEVETGCEYVVKSSHQREEEDEEEEEEQEDEGREEGARRND